MGNIQEKKGSSLFHAIALDAAVTLVSEACVLLTFFLFYRLLNNQLSVEAVGVYSLLRRVLALFIPVVLLGMPEGLCRYIAMAKTKTEIQKTVFNSFIILFVSLLITILLLHIDKGMSSKIFLGDLKSVSLVSPFSVFLVGVSLHTFIYSCLRGGLRIKLANMFQLINLGLVPIFLLLFYKFRTIEELLVSLGIVQVIIALLFLLLMLDQIKIEFKLFSWKTIIEMLRYGAPRVPGALAGAGLISLGPVISSHFISVVETGYLSLSLTLLVGLGGAISPLGSVLLPHVSGLVRSGNREHLEKKMHILVGAITQVLMFVFFQVVVFSDFILKMWMGEKFLSAAPLLIAVFFSLNAYGFYVVARNIIDAVDVKPINSINTTISLLFLILSFLLVAQFASGKDLALKFAIAFSASLNLLGVLTYRSLKKLVSYDFKKDLYHFKASLFLNLAIASIAMFLKSYIAITFLSWGGGLVLFGLFYFFILWRLKFEWISLVVRKLLSGVKA